LPVGAITGILLGWPDNGGLMAIAGVSDVDALRLTTSLVDFLAEVTDARAGSSSGHLVSGIGCS